MHDSGAVGLVVAPPVLLQILHRLGEIPLLLASLIDFPRFAQLTDFSFHPLEPLLNASAIGLTLPFSMFALAIARWSVELRGVLGQKSQVGGRERGNEKEG
jgi:hypothetical protein